MKMKMLAVSVGSSTILAALSSIFSGDCACHRETRQSRQKTAAANAAGVGKLIQSLQGQTYCKSRDCSSYL